MEKTKKSEKTQKGTIKINAEGEVLGRLAARVATVLREKDTPGFLPYKTPTQKVVVFNTDKIEVTGQKKDKKIYYRHSGYPGGLTQRPLKDEMERDSREVVRRAVFGMLPKNKLRAKIIKNLTLLKGEPENK